MGGYGSGRPGWRAKCEHCLSIDVRRWAREGYLSGRRYFGWQWTINGDQTCSIAVWGHNDHIELDYTKDGEKYRYPVRLTSTRCQFGGTRQWFCCPIAGCNRRVAKLYLGRQYFACRRCNRLGYLIENQDRGQRLWMKAQKIERQLGPNLTRPKRMRERTYQRMIERYYAIEETRDAWFDCELVRRWGHRLF